MAARSPISAVSRSLHLPDQDHVRVLAQRRTQHAAERELDLVVHLHLVQAVENGIRPGLQP